MRTRPGYTKKNIIANPNCSTAQLVVALKPLHDKATIKRVVVATYQSVSGAGKDAMDELFSQTKAVYTNDELVNKKFPSASPSTSSPTSTSSWKTATPRKSGR
jgi:aspartate-semialdehyde dehydrogenase